MPPGSSQKPGREAQEENTCDPERKGLPQVLTALRGESSASETLVSTYVLVLQAAWQNSHLFLQLCKQGSLTMALLSTLRYNT
jgi:hypothetical protein